MVGPHGRVCPKPNHKRAARAAEAVIDLALSKGHQLLAVLHQQEGEVGSGVCLGAAVGQYGSRVVLRNDVESANGSSTAGCATWLESAHRQGARSAAAQP